MINFIKDLWKNKNKPIAPFKYNLFPYQTVMYPLINGFNGSISHLGFREYKYLAYIKNGSDYYAKCFKKSKEAYAYITKKAEYFSEF